MTKALRCALALFCLCAVARGEVAFTDVTAEASIDFQHFDGRNGQYHFIETLGSGVAWIDYDADGDDDLYFVNGARLYDTPPGPEPTNALYRNDGDGTFTDVTASAGVGHAGYGHGACVGDVDGDGDLDLYVTNYGANVLYRNEGDGTFTDITTPAGVGDDGWGTSSAFADYDLDGDLDLYVVNYVTYDPQDEPPCQVDGIRVHCTPKRFRGAADILYRNSGDGVFEDVSEAAGIANAGGKGLGVCWGDYDGDGYPDAYVANDTVENYLYRNSGDGSFTEEAFMVGAALSEHGEMESGMGVDWGDYDNDGLPDLIVTNFQEQVATLYHNDGDGFFTDVSYPSGTGVHTFATLGWSAVFFDYDHDGLKDLFIANGHIYTNAHEVDHTASYEQPNHLFRNLGSGVFEDVTKRVGLSARASSRGAAVADYDLDGDLDIVVTNSNSPARLLRNDGGATGGWIQVAPPLRLAVGTRVEVVTGDVTQSAVVKGGQGYMSQGALIAHFGVGAADVIDELRVSFPDGSVVVRTDVAVNQRLAVSP
ncbi:CRTAC1 family protein [Candidatus Poribacteria bacterium]|jgi:enediyne biosynthesis protein E4|nr:CRTAC1 family protein [Candidatus Poribacteria bacterium]MBT5533012.1 CRTAC1 family protein [Candidatus Poribacteria bacterium]MBT7098574.1 CRTAC1 family protein [Candidatus Poribacteria bacterium]MBT7804298.1 CRTAC1 family protein [Candidatus Poribacteria bacterium]